MIGRSAFGSFFHFDSLKKAFCPNRVRGFLLQITGKKQKDMARFKKGVSGNPAGRKKGSSNKNTKEIKEMIHIALMKAGGVEYLIGQAHTNPTAFMGLVKAILPKDVILGGQEQSPLTITIRGLKE